MRRRPRAGRNTAAGRKAKRGEWQPAPRTPGSEKVLAAVRRACLALESTTEKMAWGTPTFRVRERLFVMFADNHHGDGRLAIWCNAAPGAQEAFVANDPEHYFVPPYVGPSGWLGVRLDRGLSAPEIKARIRAAHQATLDKTRSARDSRAPRRAARARRS